MGDTTAAGGFLNGMARMASGVGLIPEQNWENPDLVASPFGTDPTTASIGFVNGGAAGSAAPLDWSAGSFVRLARDLATGTLVDVTSLFSPDAPPTMVAPVIRGS